MYNPPITNPYFYYSNPSMPYQDLTLRNEQGKCQQVFTAILAGIKGEASAIDFYTRLAPLAPNQKHKNDILHALEDEKIHLKEFTQLYINLTGQQPMYQVERKQFNSYKEGLQMAYEDELEAYEEYRNAFLLTQNPPVRDVFFRAFTDEIEHAMRFGFLLTSL